MSVRQKLSSVLLAGGGSAGHVSPLLALADCLRRRDPDLRVTALGTINGLEQRLVPARGYDLRTIPKVAFPRRPGGALVRLPGALKAAVDAAGVAIDETDPDVVVGFGGYVSTPAYLAARKRGIPIVVHEQNARAGLANRAGARMTRYVATTFAATSLPHATVIGMPLRREIAQLDRAATRAKALAHFGLDKEFVHDSMVDGPRYVVAGYVDQIDLAYACADLVVARAGANTVCELTAVGLPAVYVPLPIGNGEQRLNATEVVASGGGILVDDSALTTRWIDDALVPLMTDRSRLAAMAEAAANIGQRAADERLADLVTVAAASRAAR